MMRKKILILDDDKPLLKKLKINIRKYDVVTATNVKDAVKILLNSDISFIAVDIKLKHGKRGYTVFNKLFFKGKSIPGIIITAYGLTDGERKYLDSLGVAAILQKGSGKGTLASRIESAAKGILGSRKKRYYQITKKIEEYKLHRTIMKYENKRKTINAWMTDICSGNYSTQKAEELKDLIVKACNTKLLSEDQTDYVFPQI